MQQTYLPLALERILHANIFKITRAVFLLTIILLPAAPQLVAANFMTRSWHSPEWLRWEGQYASTKKIHPTPMAPDGFTSPYARLGGL